LAIGNVQLAVGSWQRKKKWAMCSWQLAVGSWQLAKKNERMGKKIK